MEGQNKMIKIKVIKRLTEDDLDELLKEAVSGKKPPPVDFNKDDDAYEALFQALNRKYPLLFPSYPSLYGTEWLSEHYKKLTLNSSEKKEKLREFYKVLLKQSGVNFIKLRVSGKRAILITYSFDFLMYADVLRLIEFVERNENDLNKIILSDSKQNKKWTKL